MPTERVKRFANATLTGAYVRSGNVRSGQMQFSIEFGGDPQDVTITATGPADPAAFVRMNETLESDPRFKAGLTYLIDFSGLEAAHLPPSDVEQIAARGTESAWHHPPRAVAVLAPDPRTFNQTQLAIAHMGGRKSGHRAFADLDEALDWLRDLT